MGYNRTPNTVVAGRGLKQSPPVTGTLPAGVIPVTVDGDIATTSSLGLVQVGSGLAIDPLGVLSTSGSGGNYSSGAWTPGLAGPAAGTITLTIKNAKFIKVGQLVTCFFDFKVAGLGSGTNSSLLYLTGLPFLSITDTGTVGSVYTSYWEFMDLNLVDVSGTVNSNDTKALLWKANSPQNTLSSLVRDDIRVGSTLAGTAVYFSAS